MYIYVHAAFLLNFILKNISPKKLIKDGNWYNFIFNPIFAYFLVRLFEIYPDISHNFNRKALKIGQNMGLKKI